jgi:hypothetical protein
LGPVAALSRRLTTPGVRTVAQEIAASRQRGIPADEGKLWETLRLDAERAAAGEEMLRSFLDLLVLRHDGFASGLSLLLAHKLAEDSMPAERLGEIARAAMAGDPGIDADLIHGLILEQRLPRWAGRYEVGKASVWARPRRELLQTQILQHQESRLRAVPVAMRVSVPRRWTWLHPPHGLCKTKRLSLRVAAPASARPAHAPTPASMARCNTNRPFRTEVDIRISSILDNRHSRTKDLEAGRSGRASTRW